MPPSSRSCPIAVSTHTPSPSSMHITQDSTASSAAPHPSGSWRWRGRLKATTCCQWRRGTTGHRPAATPRLQGKAAGGRQQGGGSRGRPGLLSRWSHDPSWEVQEMYGGQWWEGRRAGTLLTLISGAVAQAVQQEDGGVGAGVRHQQRPQVAPQQQPAAQQQGSAVSCALLCASCCPPGAQGWQRP